LRGICLRRRPRRIARSAVGQQAQEPVSAEAGLGVVTIAAAHTAWAFLVTALMVGHVYPALTTAELPLGNLKAMITRYEERSPT
jgi:hypothetical protein